MYLRDSTLGDLARQSVVIEVQSLQQVKCGLVPIELVKNAGHVTSSRQRIP